MHTNFALDNSLINSIFQSEYDAISSNSPIRNTHMVDINAFNYNLYIVLSAINAMVADSRKK
ncbi:hypothetical protein DSUL_60227 [Desulfovibrionales bacterium]